MIVRLSKMLLSLVLLCCLASCATQGANGSSSSAFEQGQQSFKEGNYQSAFHLLYPLAMDGQPDAQYAVGYMLYYGKGVVENQQIGEAWIREAAVHGQSQAEQALRLLTQKGMFNISSNA